MTDEKITVFRCPYFDECNKIPLKTYFFDGEPLEHIEMPECVAPFLAHNGDHLCALVLEKSELDKYPNNIKGITLYNSLMSRIKRWWHR